MVRMFLQTRREFLKVSSAALAGLAFPRAASGQRQAAVRFGMVTDPHYADCEERGTRFYRQSSAKMRECVELMNAEGVDFLIELGDFKDQDEPGVEADTLRYLEEIESELAAFAGPRYHVLGNHDMDSISKAQFLAGTENTGIDPRLDGEGPVFVNNADEVRLLMRRRGNVIAAFHGHDHAGDHREIDDIHFYTLRAAVEGSGLDNSSYAIVGVHADGLTISGYRRAVSHDLLEAP